MGSRESLEGGEHNGEIGFSNGDESWLIWWREKQGRRGIRLSWEPPATQSRWGREWREEIESGAYIK